MQNIILTKYNWYRKEPLNFNLEICATSSQHHQNRGWLWPSMRRKDRKWFAWAVLGVAGHAFLYFLVDFWSMICIKGLFCKEGSEFQPFRKDFSSNTTLFKWTCFLKYQHLSILFPQLSCLVFSSPYAWGTTPVQHLTCRSGTHPMDVQWHRDQTDSFNRSYF